MSVASFNPIFGQDMSMAVLDTLQFHHALAEGNNDQLDPTYYVRAANVVDEVWDITVGGDFHPLSLKDPARTPGVIPARVHAETWTDGFTSSVKN